MTAAKKQKPTATVWTALRKRFPAPEWAYFDQVRNGTGYSRRVTRTADALALGLWPSRGMELHGIEVKTARGDWLREKGDPAKAEEIAKFCDRWWLVTDEHVARIEEVPAGWGWLEFNGKVLVERRPADRLQAVPLDKPMIAAIFRRAAEAQASVLSEQVEPLVQERVANHLEHYKRAEEVEEKMRRDAQDRANRAESLLNDVGGAIGVKFWTDGYPRVLHKELPPEVTAKLEAFRSADLATLRGTLAIAAENLRRGAVQARQALRAAGVRPERRRRFGE